MRHIAGPIATVQPQPGIPVVRSHIEGRIAASTAALHDVETRAANDPRLNAWFAEPDDALKNCMTPLQRAKDLLDDADAKAALDLPEDHNDPLADLRDYESHGKKLFVLPDDPDFERLVVRRDPKTWHAERIAKAAHEATQNQDFVIVSSSSSASHTPSTSMSSSTRRGNTRFSYKEDVEDEETQIATALSLSLAASTSVTSSKPNSPRKPNYTEYNLPANDPLFDMSPSTPAAVRLESRLKVHMGGDSVDLTSPETKTRQNITPATKRASRNQQSIDDEDDEIVEVGDAPSHGLEFLETKQKARSGVSFRHHQNHQNDDVYAPPSSKRSTLHEKPKSNYNELEMNGM
ncbi:hypothetical protein HDU98_006329 [Podochytrium sp. JEL0797]|nr:hypothetical protein HDU98_006329 [Podochytrium sp. JEL0797]